MSSRRLSATDVRYPAIFLHQLHIRVWPRPVNARFYGHGLLVDADGYAVRVVGVDESNPLERRQPFDRPVTFLCEGEGETLSVQEIVRRIAFVVSARGHFESPVGFGLPAALSSATSMSELLEILIHNGIH